jgi:hypothetical protein
MATIPAGYQLSITSWENDGDNYKTKILYGLTREDVQFYLHFLKPFGEEFGGEEIRTGDNCEQIAIESAWNKFPPTSPDLVQDVTYSIEFWKENPHQTCDWVYETIGTDESGDFYRVFDSFKVHYIKTPIDDVTDKFR